MPEQLNRELNRLIYSTLTFWVRYVYPMAVTNREVSVLYLISSGSDRKYSVCDHAELTDIGNESVCVIR